MKTAWIRSAWALALASTCIAAAAQGASGPGPGRGPGMGGMRGWHSTSENTPGWSMMTPAERQAHQERMRSMSDHGACSAYMKEHHEQMAARAKERGLAMPAQPRHDACSGLKKP